MVDDSWHLADGTCDLSFEQSPRSAKSLRRQCVEKSSVGNEFYVIYIAEEYASKFTIN